MKKCPTCIWFMGKHRGTRGKQQFCTVIGFRTEMCQLLEPSLPFTGGLGNRFFQGYTARRRETKIKFWTGAGGFRAFWGWIGSHVAEWNILSSNELHPFRYQRVQGSLPADYPHRVNFSRWYLKGTESLSGGDFLIMDRSW